MCVDMVQDVARCKREKGLVCLHRLYRVGLQPKLCHKTIGGSCSVREDDAAVQADVSSILTMRGIHHHRHFLLNIVCRLQTRILEIESIRIRET